MKDFEKFFHKAQKHIRKIQLASWNNNRNKSQNLKKKNYGPQQQKLTLITESFELYGKSLRSKCYPWNTPLSQDQKSPDLKSLRNNGPFGQAKPKQHE